MSNSSAPAAPHLPPPLPTVAAAAGIDAHRTVARQLNDLLSAHQQTFAPAEQGRAPESVLPPFQTLLAAARKKELLGVGLLDLRGRRSARLRARPAAQAWEQDLMARAHSDRSALQAQLDGQWATLQANEPEVVVPAVAARFLASGRPARATEVYDGVVEIAVTLPSLDAVPSTRPAVTAAGSPTVQDASRAERALWYRHHVATQMLLAAKEAFAAAPGLTGAHVVASYDGRPLVEGRLERAAFHRISWSLFPWDALVAIDAALLFGLAGQTGELQPLGCAEDLGRDRDAPRARLTPGR